MGNIHQQFLADSNALWDIYQQFLADSNAL